MSQPIQCPACLAMNKPGAPRCRMCGRKLTARTAKPAPTPPVTLQRVMSGEIFTAVVGDIPKASIKADEGPVAKEGATEDVVTLEAEPVDEIGQVLASLAGRLEQSAAAAKQRFKPYRPDRPRRADTTEARRVFVRHMEGATSAIREKRFEEAIQHLLKAIAREDSDPRPWLLLGGTYLRLDQPYKAAVGFLRALELDARAGNAWVGLSRAFKAVGDLNGSLEVLDRAVETSPQIPEAWSERGIVLEALQNLGEAMKSFARALELRPELRIARERHAALSSQLPPGDVPAPVAPARAQEAIPAEVPPETPRPEVGAISDEAEDLPSFDDLRGPVHPAPKPSTRPARVRTFVEGLDDTMGGGIPWGHVVLIQGAPGTMKSSLGFSILLQNAAKEGLHTLYLSLEERASSLLKQMGSLGLKFHVDQGSLVVLDPRTAKGLLSEHADWVETFERALAAIKAERGLDLVVIDSLEALEVLAKFEDHRREVFRLFEWLRDLGVTSFLITERPDWVIAGHVIQGRWDEDFLADGVLHLRQHLVTDLEVQRRLRVVKMRGTRHDTGYLALVLDEGRFKVTRAMSP